MYDRLTKDHHMNCNVSGVSFGSRCSGEIQKGDVLLALIRITREGGYIQVCQDNAQNSIETPMNQSTPRQFYNLSNDQVREVKYILDDLVTIGAASRFDGGYRVRNYQYAR